MNGAARFIDGRIHIWTGATTGIELPMQAQFGAWFTSHPKQRIAAPEQFVAGTTLERRRLRAVNMDASRTLIQMRP